MTDQSTREQWTRPTQTLERAGPERTEPESSTQDSPTGDPAAHAAEHTVDGGPDPQSTQQHDGVAVAAGPVGPMDDINEAGDVTDDQAPAVPASVEDTAVSDVSGSGELLPGDAPTGPVALFDGAMTERFRDRWQQLQLRFIDDPPTVTAQAGAMADEVVSALRDAVDQHRTALEDWQSDNGVDAHFGDTERLRVAVGRYRDFVDRLLAM